MEPDLSVLEFLGLFLALLCAGGIVTALYSAARWFVAYVNNRNEQAYHDWRIRKLYAECEANGAYVCTDGHADDRCPDCDAKSGTVSMSREIGREASDEEDGDCVVVPRRNGRRRSRSPYETRSTARRLRDRS